MPTTLKPKTPSRAPEVSCDFNHLGDLKVAFADFLEHFRNARPTPTARDAFLQKWRAKKSEDFAERLGRHIKKFLEDI